MPSANHGSNFAARRAFPRGVAIVGLGRWGTSLHAALLSAGITVETVAHAAELPRATLNAEMLWLCVPDAKIVEAAAAIVKLRGSLRRQVVVHSSGVSSSSLLAVARKAGARVASVHPWMTFPTRRPVDLQSVPFAVEGVAALAVKLEGLVRRLGGVPFRVPAAGKVLYHAAAVMASPLLVSLASAAQEMTALAGLSHEQASALLEPMMLATIRNFFRDGARHSFSGPFARGDAETVSLHLEALAGHPSLQQVYRALAMHALEVLPVGNAATLRRLVETPRSDT